MACKAAIFDLDGTILDSMPVWCNLCGEFLKKYGISKNIDLDGKLGVISIASALEYVIKEFKLDIDLESACRQAWQIVGTFYREEVELKPGIAAILDELKRKNIPAGIITASETGLVRDALKRVGLEDYFDGGIISCADLQTSKRTPEVFYIMSEKLGAAPEDTFVFEDALYAGATAKKAGYTLAAVYDPSEKNPDKLAGLADYYCQSWEDFPLDVL